MENKKRQPGGAGVGKSYSCGVVRLDLVWIEAELAGGADGGLVDESGDGCWADATWDWGDH